MYIGVIPIVLRNDFTEKFSNLPIWIVDSWDEILLCDDAMLESKYLEKEFENYIFLTYNGPIFKEILPNLPTLYIRSKKGFSRPPWIP